MLIKNTANEQDWQLWELQDCIIVSIHFALYCGMRLMAHQFRYVYHAR